MAPLRRIDLGGDGIGIEIEAAPPSDVGAEPETLESGQVTCRRRGCGKRRVLRGRHKPPSERRSNVNTRQDSRLADLMVSRNLRAPCRDPRRPRHIPGGSLEGNEPKKIAEGVGHIRSSVAAIPTGIQ